MDINCMGYDCCTTELLPETEEEALAQGWRQTDNFHVSPRLDLVWLCPECVGRLVSVITMQMRTVEHDALSAYERSLHDLMESHRVRLENLRRWHAQGMDTIHRSYGKALDQLRSPESKAAEVALQDESDDLLDTTPETVL